MNTKPSTLRTVLIDAVKVDKVVTTKTGSISNALLVVARQFQSQSTIGTVSSVNADRFLDACKLEESFIRSTEARRNKVDKLPRSFTQPKSNIKAALNLGLSLANFNTESSLRKEVQALRKAAATNPVDTAIAGLKKSLATVPSKQALDIISRANAELAAILAALVPRQPKAHQETASQCKATMKANAQKAKANRAKAAKAKVAQAA